MITRSSVGNVVSPWPLTFGAMIGMVMSASAVNFATSSLFIGPVTESLGWTRTQYFAASSVGVMASALAVTLVGGVADRLGVRRVLLVGIPLYALTIGLQSTLTGSMLQFLIISLLIGAMTSVQGPLLYSKAVSQAVDRRRGLALAVAMTGSAIGMAVLPHAAGLLITNTGWRTAYVGLAIVIVVVAFPAVWLLIRPPIAPVRKPGEAPPTERPGLPMREVLQTQTFWLLLIVFTLSSAGINGSVAHLGAIVVGKDLAMQWAASCLTAVAIGQVFARFGAGFLLDRFPTAQVGQVWFFCALAGIAAMSQVSTPLGAVVASLLLGAGVGAEMELLAFYVGRFFGLRAFGRVYGLIFCGFLVGVAGGGVLLATLFDRWGDYSVALAIALVMTAVAAVALLFVGRYVFVPDEDGPRPAKGEAPADGVQRSAPSQNT